jgi:hypothetical protein
MCEPKSIIKNINVPSCRNCIYYKPCVYGDEFSSTYSTCEKFGEKDIITDKIKYYYVELCRDDELKCGKSGKYFEKDEFINTKLLKYLIMKNLHYGVIALPIFILVVSILGQSITPCLVGTRVSTLREITDCHRSMS